LAQSGHIWIGRNLKTFRKPEKGWAYPTAVIDLFDHKVTGWSLSETIKAIDRTIAAFSLLHYFQRSC